MLKKYITFNYSMQSIYDSLLYREICKTRKGKLYITKFITNNWNKIEIHKTIFSQGNWVLLKNDLK